MTSRAELACTVCQAIDSFRDWIPKIGEAVVDAQELGLEEKDSAGLVRQVSGEAGLQSEGILALPSVQAVPRGARPGSTAEARAVLGNFPPGYTSQVDLKHKWSVFRTEVIDGGTAWRGV